MPEMPDAFVETVSERYIELYETIIGKKFIKADYTNINQRIENHVEQCLLRLSNSNN